ncbi:capsular biosynthesis protein [Methylomonas paludis]|uniref:protein-tyrosine-phosphatase n=1 Tax=Methylomonas paludis TaxID=1173101 RepID=A0A975MLY6_9GAMM|nr:CpsB/CapC family capsule biosynthesis tyrosine phosphatase [Methylomonas paludis]QWF70049.1 capsular biosynthesis protein [Methylomonas paludis]
MIDLHCHLLPGIDDGPKNLDDSLKMAAYAVEQGITQAVVTPHIHPGTYDNDINNIQTVFSSFKQAVNANNINLKLSMAAEVRLCSELPIMISQNRIPFLGMWQNKKVLLLEFPHDHIPLGAEKLVIWLLQKGIMPMIAHPERNLSVLAKKEKILPFINAGCLLQITASSVTGLFGEASKNTALWLIANKYATLMATDAHNLHKRIPTMLAASEIVEQAFGNKYMQLLTEGNATIIVNS